MSSLNGKNIVVTGASKGIGAGIAIELASRGASVVVNYASSKDKAEGVVAEITAKGGRAIAVRADMSNAADVKQLFAEAEKAFGTLDVLVNNAGVYKFIPFLESTEDDFHWHYNTNVLSAFLATQEAVKHFGPSGGSVINLSSIVSTHPQAAMSLYASSKAAIDNLTRTMALELGSKKIRVNAVAPGYTETEGTHATGFLNDDSIKELGSQSPFGRMGQPHDIATAVAFFASDDSAWITGETIRVAGGVL
ncbi:MAG: glucose 1-dehydrogenase [Phycisphaerales bacterium]